MSDRNDWLPGSPLLPEGARLRPTTLCENCGRRPATVKWCGEAGMLAFTHGFAKDWCEACALGEQVKHAEKAAAELPELRRRLAEAEAQ
jgi:hypothetical protein